MKKFGINYFYFRNEVGKCFQKPELSGFLFEKIVDDIIVWSIASENLRFCEFRILLSCSTVTHIQDAEEGC